MKNIELTEEHKSKLLEMCKVLFPELNLEMYYDDDISDNWEEALENNSCGNDAQVGYLISNWHKPNAKIIHWFEFCMTHLVDKISLKIAELEDEADECIKQEFMHELSKINNIINPIDYLYEEFKNIE